MDGRIAEETVGDVENMKGKDLLDEIINEELEEKKAVAKKEIRAAKYKVTVKRKALKEAEEALDELLEKSIEDFKVGRGVDVSFRSADTSVSRGRPPWLECSDGENDD